MLEDYYFEVVIELEGLRERWKEDANNAQAISERITALEKLLAEGAQKEGLTGDPWLDEWLESQGDEDDEDDEPAPAPPPPSEVEPADLDDWQDVKIDG